MHVHVNVSEQDDVNTVCVTVCTGTRAEVSEMGGCLSNERQYNSPYARLQEGTLWIYSAVQKC